MVIQIEDNVITITTPSKYIFTINIGIDQLTIQGDTTLELRDNHISSTQLEVNKLKVKML
jgi:hypothetical protein